MPFIGTQPDVGGYSVLDNLTASATASYTLQKDSANFVPSSANQLLVSLNGVIQKPGTSFTVSGSTLTFSSALTSSDSIDFILAMGEPLLVGTPSDGTVNTDKLASNAVTNAKIASGVSASKLTTGTLPFDAFPAHTPIQMKTTAIATGSTATRIPFDNSVPTTSEGYEACTLNFTPTYNNSKILIECSFVYDKYSSNTAVIGAVFRGTTCIGVQTTGDQDPGIVHIYCVDEPASTSQQTYSLRIGGNTNNSIWVHSRNSGPLFGGNNSIHGSDFIVTEIKQ